MIPSTSDVSALLGTLFGCGVETTDTVATSPPWALALFETPERGLVAAAAVDMVLVATMGAAIVGYPADTAEDAVAKGKVAGELWDNFAEVLNVMNGLFMDDGDHSRVILHSAQRLDGDQWQSLLAQDLPVSVLSVEVAGYPAGQLALMDLGDRSLSDLGLERRKDPTAPPPAPTDPRWRPHDFRQPTGVSRSLLRSLHVHLGEVARTMASTLAGRLQAKVHHKVLQIRHVGRDELVTGVGHDVLVFSFRVEGMEGRFLLAWDLKFSMCLLDMLLGGTGVPFGEPRKPTVLDLSLLEPAVRQVLAVVPNLLQPFVPERTLNLGESRTDLELNLPADAAGGTWLATYLSTDLAGTEHQAMLAIPMLALQPILERIANGEKRFELEGEEGTPAFSRAVLGVPGDVHVHFPTMRVAAERIAALAPGDVLVLDGMRDAALHLRCGQVHVADVEPVVHGTRLCVRVREGAEPTPAPAATPGSGAHLSVPVHQLVHSA